MRALVTGCTEWDFPGPTLIWNPEKTRKDDSSHNRNCPPDGARYNDYTGCRLEELKRLSRPKIWLRFLLSPISSWENSHIFVERVGFGELMGDFAFTFYNEKKG